MALNYGTATYNDLSKGIDTRSVPNLIQDGYSQDLVNVIANSEGHLEKRKGYQGYYGYIPLRAQAINYTATSGDDNIEITLDSSIDLKNISSVPIIVYGTLSNDSMGGDFNSSSNNTIFYEEFTAKLRETLSTGSNTITKTSADMNISGNAVTAKLVESTSSTDDSNSWIMANSMEVDSASGQLDVTYTNGTGNSFESFLYFFDKSAVGGEVYHHTITASASESITAVTHGLNNFNIIVQVEELDSGKYKLIQPDSVTIDQSTGEVNITLSSAITGRAILSSVPIINNVTGTVAAGATETITINSPNTPFINVACYLEPTIGADLELCIPDSVIYDETADTTTISFTNSGTSTANFELYYEFTTLTLSTLKVTGTVTATGIDNNPQISIWGIDHDGIYTSGNSAAGHITHIDSYKKLAESRLLCGLGGNIFRALEASEIGSTVAPELYINLRGRVQSDTVIAPIFQETGTSLNRSQGTIEGDNVSDYEILVDAVSYSGTGNYVDYVLKFENKQSLDSSGIATTADAVISTTSNLEDYLVIRSMNHSRLNGTFKIIGVTDDTPTSEHVTIRVENTDIDSSDYDESLGSTGGKASINTNRITFTSTSSFETDDILTCESFISSDIVTVSSSSGSSIVVSDIERTISLPLGLRMYGTRTSNEFTLRTEDGTLSVDYLVNGDMLAVTGFDRRIRILSTDLTNSTITLDESISLTDSSSNSISLRPIGRWYPIEIPTSDGNILANTKTTHFDSNDYADQSTIRSTIIADNMYFTNDDDEVFKFDGTNIYRAGLYRWQPQLFASLDADSNGTFQITDTEVSAIDEDDGIFTVDSVASFTIGDEIYFSQDGNLYTITDIDTTAKTITVDSTLPTLSGTPFISLYQEFRYYFRLNAIDANNNIIASACTGSEDFRFRVVEDGYINMKLVGKPAWDIYDYDRIELQVYRTKNYIGALTAQTVFYNIAILDLSFDNSEGYINFRDAILDDSLTEGDLDPQVSVLLETELPLTWNEPQRAKHITSAANRLILANIKGYPKLDITINKLSGSTELTSSDLVQTNEVRWLFRKDSNDSGTSTDMINRAAYEFVDDSSEVSITPNTDITTTATTFTVASTAHGLIAGDWVYFYHNDESTDNDLTFTGWYQIASVNTNDFTINCSNHDRGVSGGIADDIDRYVTASTTTDIPVLLGTDGNYNQKNGNPSSSRPYNTTAMLRLANAINSTMRMVDINISGYSSFIPWLTAASGSEFGSGRLIIKQPKVIDTSLELVLDSAHGTSYQVFVNNIRRTASASIGTETNLYPSRLTVSYPNYPEIFDGPAEGGTSDIDVNSADGQELTGVLPFFSEAAFGSSQKEAVIVAFKTQSIYLINVETQEVQKIDSQGLGCTFPYSIAPTKDGIMFANRSGIYRLNYDLTVSYVGEALEGLWKETVNRDATNIITGHHYALERRYELSIPINSSTVNSQVYVYDHNREETEEYGAWVRFTNFNATGWANLDNDAFFGSTVGQVFSIRRTGNVSDYRDDADAVAEMEILTKPFSFGVAGIRHKLRAIISHFKIDENMLGTTLETAVDLSENFVATSSFSITNASSTNPYLDRQVVSLRSSIPNSKFVYLQLKFLNSTKDEPVVLAGLNFVAAALNKYGIQQENGTNISS